MSTLADTNILARLAKPTDPEHRVAADAVDLLGKAGEQICLVPQNFYEFWSVATRPLTANGLGMSVAETQAEFVKFRRLFTVLDETPALLPEWERLVSHFGVTGKNAHDARLVAAMTVHGVGRILTFNDADFRRFTGITVITPDEVLQASP
jgi:predicted nucleic acid-binding protein